MKRGALPAAALLCFVAVAFYLNHLRHGHTRVAAPAPATARLHPERHVVAERIDPERLRSVAYLERYIVDVINHGSAADLGFKYGEMPAGMADAKAAPKIAAYVVSLAGLRPTHPEWVREGQTFYVSNCGGCHGEDGRGVHGTFPDLTRRPLLGIERRLRALRAAGTH